MWDGCWLRWDWVVPEWVRMGWIKVGFACVLVGVEVGFASRGEVKVEVGWLLVVMGWV